MIVILIIIYYSLIITNKIFRYINKCKVLEAMMMMNRRVKNINKVDYNLQGVIYTVILGVKIGNYKYHKGQGSNMQILMGSKEIITI